MNGILNLARAYDFAARMHVHQRRKGEAAEPYVGHLAEVVLGPSGRTLVRLADLGLTG